MNRNRLAYLLILAAALNFSGCGAPAESARGDVKAAGATPAVGVASPTPVGGVNANTVAKPADAGSAGSAGASSQGSAASQSGASNASGSRGAGGAPPAKAPTPQIGSGGNDFFLFTQARAAVANDPELNAANIIVDVKEGVVTLSGVVASAQLKSKAEQMARGLGPKGVRNQLRVSEK
ncbi:MAG TPA: BON domain-containing protein [Pyrinomonadaceae bacterium]|jgi:hypothetical protein